MIIKFNKSLRKRNFKWKKVRSFQYACKKMKNIMILDNIDRDLLSYRNDVL